VREGAAFDEDVEDGIAAKIFILLDDISLDGLSYLHTRRRMKRLAFRIRKVPVRTQTNTCRSHTVTAHEHQASEPGLIRSL